MSSLLEHSQKAVPAQLGFLAIYNPSLGTTDETFAQQIVYYCSPSKDGTSNHSRFSHANTKEALTQGESDEQMRQIGLAQGMVEFGKSFSDGQSVDSIDTEKSKIILHELEPGWWILASIDLTRLPRTNATTNKGKGKEGDTQEPMEYSSREVKPTILLLGDLLRAHATFLLHHASSMSALFVRTRRSKFINILARYWDTYLSTWNVLMHGNPANSLYGGIKLAACGELGYGVGEEERGSGERAVLEGFVGRIEGLVDVVVSTFGGVDKPALAEPPRPVKGSAKRISGPWLGSGEEAAAEDGAIFLGTGALSRKSLRDVTHWMEDLYKWGSYAYGVIDNPSSTRQTKSTARRKAQESVATMCSDQSPDSRQGEQLKGRGPRSASPNGRHSLDILTQLTSPKQNANIGLRRPPIKRGHSSVSHVSTDSDSAKANKFVQYLRLGYGTHWSLGTQLNKTDRCTTSEDLLTSPSPNSMKANSAFEDTDDKASIPDDTNGYYLIGLLGDVDDVQAEGDATNARTGGEHNDRTLVRTITVELERAEDARPEADISIDLGILGSDQNTSHHGGSEHTATTNTSYDSGQDRNKSRRLRVVVYVKKPLMFVFLFELRTDALAWTSLYRSLHQQTTALFKPLSISTKYRALEPSLGGTESKTPSTPIYNLVWDPHTLSISSTIPNIPEPLSRSSELPPWSRIEALNTHMQIINTYLATTAESGQLERTCKTSRGWWVVWTLIPDLEPSSTSLASGHVKIPKPISENMAEATPSSFLGPDKSKSYTSGIASRSSTRHSSGKTRSMNSTAHPFLDVTSPASESIPRDKEIFLIRRASDHNVSRSSSNRFSSPTTTEVSAPGNLVQGIGIDTKRYIDALLNMTI